MSLRKGLAGVATPLLALGMLGRPASTFAQEAADATALLERLATQEQRTLILERKLELQEEAAKAAASANAVVRAGPTRFSVQSADGTDVLRIRGLLHFDGRYFPDAVTPKTADTFVFRRVRPTVEGTLNGIFDYRFTPDFAGGRTIVLDAYLAARLQPWAVIQAGKFKVPVGLERLVSASDIRFIERAFPSSLLPNRDLGVQLGGDVGGGVLSYSIGYFNGVSDGGSSDGNTPADAENDTRGDLAARAFVQPFLNSDNFYLRGFGIGVAGTYVDSTGSTTIALLPTYRTPGQQTFFSYRGNTAATATAPASNDATFAAGKRLRWTPQVYYSVGPFGVLGEYASVSQDVARVNGTVARSDSLETTAWHVQLAWFLTGEDQAFRGFVPTSTFAVGKPGWGAVEVVARYHELDVDDDAFTGGTDSFANPATSASKASAWGVGLNWYLTQGIKASIDYDRTSFAGGAATGDRDDEEALFSRIGFSF